MKKYKLDTEEQDILDAFDTNEFQSDISPSRRDFIKKSALQISKKDKRINSPHAFLTTDRQQGKA